MNFQAKPPRNRLSKLHLQSGTTVRKTRFVWLLFSLYPPKQFAGRLQSRRNHQEK